MAGDVLVGRDTELARIRACLNLAANGDGKCVVLVGEPGIGKTRLAREALDDAKSIGFGTLTGRCFEQYAGEPFSPFTELLTDAWEAAPAAVRDDALERWPDLGRIIPDLVPPPSQQHEDAQQRIRRSVIRFLRACAAERPLFVLLDDLHWADSASLDLLLDLGRHLRGAHIVLVGTYRDMELGVRHPLEGVLRELLRERVLEEINVQRLPREGTAALVGARLGSTLLAVEFAQLVHARTAGNPFFIEELLKALVEDGTLINENGGWQCKPAGGIQVPRSLRSVIDQRVGRLTPGVRELLHLASVLGQEFDLDVLLAASDQPETEVLDNLDAALGAKLIEEQRRDRVEAYSFTHALIRQTMFDELPAHRRRRLHQRAGEALELVRGTRLQTWAELARHFAASGDAQRAIRYAIGAAERAAQLHAHAEAAEYYRIALDLVQEQGDVPQAAQLQRCLGGELHELNERVDALATFDAALSSYRLLGDVAGEAEMHREIAWVHQARSEFGAAAPHLEAALQLWPVDGDEVELARLLLDSARVKLYAGALRQSSELCERGLKLAEAHSDSALLARALVEHAFIKAVVGARSEEVVELLNRAERLAIAADPKLLNRLYYNRGVARWRSGALASGIADCQRGIAAAERVEQAGAAAWFSHFLASMQMQRGDWEAARATLARARALDAHVSEYAHLLPWMDGEHEAAVQVMRRAVDEARARGDGRTVAERLSELADALLQLERMSEAEAVAREAVSLVDASGWRSLELVLPHAIAAEIFARIGTADAEAALTAAEQFAEQQDDGLARPALLRARGLFEVARGRRSAGLSALEASATQARAQGALIQLGRTLSAFRLVVRAGGDSTFLSATENELIQVVQRIGPEVQRLPWAAVRQVVVPPRIGKSAEVGPVAVLTRREREVAALVAQGLTDRQIADALVITEGTVGVHLGHILNKLGFHSRAQLAAWATQHRVAAGAATLTTRDSGC